MKQLPLRASYAFGFLALAFPAAAAVPSDPRSTASGSAQAVEDRTGAPVRLAQAREVEIYYDRDGNEVLVDPYTGRAIAVRPSRRQGNDRYYLDSPEDMERLRRRREREIELGRREPPPGSIYREESYPEPGFDGDFADRRYENPADDGYDEPDQALPQAPRPGEEPQFAEREPVTRSPLAPPSGSIIEAPSSDTTGTVEPPRLSAPGDQPTVPQLGPTGASEEIAAIQIILDRTGASPGVIDGRMGDNVNKAISAYREITGQALRTYDKDTIAKLLEETGGPAFTEYTITAVDAAGPYVASIPEDYGKKATLERLGYTSVAEAIAERFHMDEAYLKRLNPGADFSKPGTVLKVANPGTPGTSEVARIVADKGARQVKAFDATGKLVAAYPATIGSSDTPSPTGTHTVERIAFNPEYTYNPKLNFKQGDNDKVLTIPPGPNGPVGSIWIALSKPTYGIHGTPEPSKIGKTESHGCIRLTNWDAEDLAKRVKKGVIVQFVE